MSLVDRMSGPRCANCSIICLHSLCLNSLGAIGIIFGLPVLIYAFTFACNDVSGCPAPSLLSPSTLSLNKLKKEVGWPKEGITALYDTQVTLGVLGYYALSLVLYVFLPGHHVEGTELACGGKLKYKFNGIYIPQWRKTVYWMRF